VSPYPAWPFLSDPSHPFLSAVWAVLIHGVLGLVVVAPIVWRSGHRLGYAALAFVGGSLLDADHFIVAGTFNLHTIETLSGGRPLTHSLIFVVLLAGLTIALSGRPLFGWTVFAVNCEHLLFDAAGSHERIFYPLNHPDGIPWLLCPLGALVFFAASREIARRAPRASPQPAGIGLA
jgi:hypothetical protein